jgi:hypothetical protein
MKEFRNKKSITKRVIFLILELVSIIAVCIVSIVIGKIIFDAIINSDMPMFWKWFLLK